MSKLQSSTVFGKSISRLHCERKIFNGAPIRPFVPGIDESPLSKPNRFIARDSRNTRSTPQRYVTTVGNDRARIKADDRLDNRYINKRPRLSQSSLSIRDRPKPSKRMPSRPLYCALNSLAIRDIAKATRPAKYERFPTIYADNKLQIHRYRI